jgi:hypothetical protein
MHRARLLALATAGAVALSACAGTIEVTSERAEPIRGLGDDPTLTAPAPAP